MSLTTQSYKHDKPKRRIRVLQNLLQHLCHGVVGPSERGQRKLWPIVLIFERNGNLVLVSASHPALRLKKTKKKTYKLWVGLVIPLGQDSSDAGNVFLTRFFGSR